MSAFFYKDLMYTGAHSALCVRATLTLLSQVKHGSRSDHEVRWRPNHNFGPPDSRDFYIGQVEFEATASSTIEPGETRKVLVRFIDGPGLRDLLHTGRSWRIQEGPNLIATASVIEVVGET